MTYPPIQDLGMTDTEYAAFVAKGYEPVLERQLIALGEDPDQAQKFTRFVGLLQGKPPETSRNGKSSCQPGKKLAVTSQALTDQ